MAKPTYQDITQSIERKEQLEKQFQEKEASVSILNRKIQKLSRDMREVNNAVRGARAAYERRHLNSDQSNLDSIVSDQVRIESDFNQAKHEMEVAQDDLHQIKTNLLSFRSDVNVSYVLEHQNKIKGVKEELEKFTKLISDQQEIIEKSQIPIDNTQELLNQRKGLLVDIALGMDHKKELDELDQALENKMQDDQAAVSKNKKLLDHAQQTVEGLEPRKEAIQSQLINLERLTPSILDQLTIGMAEELAQKYKKSANDMGKALTNLAAMDAFVSELGVRENTGLFPVDRWHMKIPRLNFMIEDECTGFDDRSYMDIANVNVCMNKELIEIKEGLRKKGIELI